MSKKNKTKDKSESKSNTTYMLVAAIAVLIVAGLYLTGQGSAGDEISTVGNVVDTPVGNTGSGDVFTISLSELSTNMKQYTYNDDGVKINFIGVLGSDGEPRIAFDACEVCGGSKGYRQSGTDVVCNNCGRHFKIDDLGTANRGGGCWPAYMPFTVNDGEIVIKNSDLEPGRRFF